MPRSLKIITLISFTEQWKEIFEDLLQEQDSNIELVAIPRTSYHHFGELDQFKSVVESEIKAGSKIICILESFTGIHFRQWIQKVDPYAAELFDSGIAVTRASTSQTGIDHKEYSRDWFYQFDILGSDPEEAAKTLAKAFTKIE